MAKKRRRGFERNTPAPAAGRHGGSGERAATEARRRNAAVLITVGAAAVIVIVALGGGTGAAGPAATTVAAATDRPGLTSSDFGPTPTIGGTAPEISGIECDVNEFTTYHVHAHLNIRIGGRLYLPPANVGILPTCLYWLHTHQGQGVIHIEAPAPTMFTLGQFFDVWGQPLSSTQVLDATVGQGRSLFMFIDGQPYDGDPRAIELGNLVSIELQVGPEQLDSLPYAFPVDLQ
jgi:hypothetical protein